MKEGLLVKVLKEGTQIDLLAKVTDPAWKGQNLVKVAMLQGSSKGETKAYLPEELVVVDAGSEEAMSMEEEATQEEEVALSARSDVSDFAADRQASLQKKREKVKRSQERRANINATLPTFQPTTWVSPEPEPDIPQGDPKDIIGDIFDSIDINHNGFIGIEELRAICKAPQAEVNGIFSMLDVDNSSKVTLEELIYVLTHRRKVFYRFLHACKPGPTLRHRQASLDNLLVQVHSEVIISGPLKRVSTKKSMILECKMTQDAFEMYDGYRLKEELPFKEIVAFEQGDLGFTLRTEGRELEFASAEQHIVDQSRDVTKWIDHIAAILEKEGHQEIIPSQDVDNRKTYKTGGGRVLKFVRKKVSKKKKRYTQGGFDLDLSYITPRIIAMGFPSKGMEAYYRNPLEEVQSFFQKHHPGHYKLYNLCSERSYESNLFEGRVAVFPFDDHNPPSLPLVEKFCDDVDEFLAANPDNVIAVHCKAGKGRTGTMISCYLLSSGQAASAIDALGQFGYERTKNGKGVTIPSQVRYVNYFARKLHEGPSDSTAVSLRLRSIRLVKVPRFDVGGGCDPYFKVYAMGKEGKNNVLLYNYKSHMKTAHKKDEDHIMEPPDNEEVILDSTVPDIKIVVLDADLTRSEKMFSFWFHVPFTTPGIWTLGKSDLDTACKDKKGKHFHADFKIEVILETSVQDRSSSQIHDSDSEDSDSEEDHDDDLSSMGSSYQDLGK